MQLAVIHHGLRGGGGAGFQLHKGTGRLAPTVIGLGHHSGGQHVGVTVQHVFDFNRRNVFTARDDDVFAAVFDLNVAIRVLHRQVAAVEPAAGKGFFGRLGVFQIPLHGDIAFEHDLPHGLSVVRHGQHRLRVEHADLALQVITHALAGIEPGSIADRQLLPFFMLGTHGGRAVHLGQTVHMGQIKAHLLHAFNHRRGRRCARHHGFHADRQTQLHFCRRIDQQAVHDRRATVMRDVVLAHHVENALRIDPT